MGKLYKPGEGRTALIVGASSGIGEALAYRLANEGWTLELLARRTDRLFNIMQKIGANASYEAIDLEQPKPAAAVLADTFDRYGPFDLVVISSGAGALNADLEWLVDSPTLAVNVTGFTLVAQAAMRHFFSQGKGHLVGITSVAALRANGPAAAYCASKSYQYAYLDGLRDLVKSKRLPIAVTEVAPGFVDTAMMKTDRPLSPLLRRLIVSTPEKAAGQIAQAIHRRAKHVYVTRRYALIAALIKLLPRPG